VESERARIQYLDGLRGIAAICVVVQHTAESIITGDPSARPLLQPEFLDLFNAGRFGVALFFLISGFVVPFSFREPKPIRTFAIGRFFRLYPAYWVSLAIALVTFPLLTGKSYPIANVLTNITMAQAIFGQPDVIGSYWTLVIELAFYTLCVGLFAARLLTDWRALVTAILTCLVLSLMMAIYASLHGTHLPTNAPVNIALMFLGTLMRLGWLEQEMAARRSIVFMTSIFAILLLPILWLPPSDRTDSNFNITPLSFCFAYWLALGCFIAASKAKMPRGQLFIALGTISYSLYLFHGICLEIMLALVPPVSAWRDVVFASGLLISAIAVAALINQVVERPFVRFSHMRMSVARDPALSRSVSS
jgi:peptidoglycan/LPS O-acetylase OafA/YrhL